MPRTVEEASCTKVVLAYEYYDYTTHVFVNLCRIIISMLTVVITHSRGMGVASWTEIKSPPPSPPVGAQAFPLLTIIHAVFISKHDKIMPSSLQKSILLTDNNCLIKYFALFVSFFVFQLFSSCCFYDLDWIVLQHIWRKFLIVEYITPSLPSHAAWL